MNTIKGTINWGIIGVGDVCEVKSGPAFSKVPNSKLVAVMRRNHEKAEDYAKRHNVPKFYTDANDLINDPEVNAIYIATPPKFHKEYALMAMEAGKPVYVEKPIALNAAECAPIIEASERLRLPAVAAHYRRGLELFRKVKQLIDERALGNIRVVSLRMFQSPNRNVIANTSDFWRIDPEVSGGGLFHDLAPHQLDLMYWFFGTPIHVNGASANQAKFSAAPDFAKLDMLFANDIRFSGIWSFSVSDDAVDDVCEIVGSNGVLRFAFFRDGKLSVSINGEVEKFEFDFPKHIQQPMIEDVVRYFRGEGENPCSIAEARESMRMIDATL